MIRYEEAKESHPDDGEESYYDEEDEEDDTPIPMQTSQSADQSATPLTKEEVCGLNLDDVECEEQRGEE